MQPLSTSPVWRALVVAVPAFLLALILGSELGKGFWLLPVTLAGGGVLLGLYILFFRAVTLDALIVGVLVFGYIVGNRGFAQLHIGGHTAIYIGELGLAACAALLGVRFAIRRSKIVPKTALGWAIVFFVILGGIRLSLDTIFQPSFASSFTAIRDAATVYYALFFFIAFQLGQNAGARRVLERCVLIGLIVLLPVAAVYIFGFPELFNKITVQGYPLVQQKGDLTTTYLAFGSFYFFLQPARGIWRACLRVLSLISFAAMLAITGRAALCGFACAVLLLLIARRPRFVFYQVAMTIALLIMIGLLQFARLSNTSPLGRVMDRVESITDISHSHSYRGDVGESSAQNNQFRLVWWESVINETMDKAPVFGLGFGYDLAKRFLISYEAPLNVVEFDTRSPHSIWITALGRMGLLGISCFAVIVFFILSEAVRVARRVAHGEAEPVTLVHWCAVLVLLGSATFGVVLEGPMGAIPFWTFLGLALSAPKKELLPQDTKDISAEPRIRQRAAASVPV
jgi:hypothetical protein